MLTIVAILLVAGICFLLGHGHGYEAAKTNEVQLILENAGLKDQLNEDLQDARALADLDVAQVIEFHTTRRPVVVTPQNRLLDDEDPLSLYGNCGIVLSTH